VRIFVDRGHERARDGVHGSHKRRERRLERDERWRGDGLWRLGEWRRRRRVRHDCGRRFFRHLRRSRDRCDHGG
jgi:hypothetical protein